MALIKEITVPDIGNTSNVDVIEILVAVGDEIAVESSLITLEGDKATMEIPSPYAGKVVEINLKVGDKVSQGDLILKLAVVDEKMQESASLSQQHLTEPASSIPPVVDANYSAANQEIAEEEHSSSEQTELNVDEPISSENAIVHAGPAVRRLARELGIDLNKIIGSGQKNRILVEDVQKFVKEALAKTNVSTSNKAFNLPEVPMIDFSAFGEYEIKPLSKIKKLSGSNLHRNWLVVPHVTQFEEADITDLEDFRNTQKAAAEAEGYKLTPLVFLMKAIVAALKKYPAFNSSLDAQGENLLLKKYYHIGVAVDTPNGLVVPVIKNVEQKGLYTLSKELAEISKKAREKGLALADMQGGCFTISSLGGIGGTGFTPIVNVPEVAILGVSKASIKPVYQNNTFIPRLMLPLSLSYDHRVIDGAEAARFIVYVAKQLADIRQLLL